jgi:hypothetical protein
MPYRDPDSQAPPSSAKARLDPKTSDRQLHFLREGCKRGLGFAELRRLVTQFYGPETKPCQLHWTEIDRLIIELWRQDLRQADPNPGSEVIDFSRWRARRQRHRHQEKDYQ